MTNKILLFIKKDATYFSTDIENFKKIISALGKIRPSKIEVIDIVDHPEMAEKYKIEALPTLIINERRYIGKPSPTKAIEIFRESSK